MGNRSIHACQSPTVAVGVIYLLLLPVLPLVPAVSALLHGQTHCTHEMCRCDHHSGHAAHERRPSIKACHGESQAAVAVPGLDKHILSFDVSHGTEVRSGHTPRRHRLPSLLFVRELVDPPDESGRSQPKATV